MISLLDTFEVKEVDEEPTNNDLEAEFVLYLKHKFNIPQEGNKLKTNGWNPSPYDLLDIAKHFAQWQKEQMVKGVDLEKELIIWHRLHFKKEGTFKKYAGFYLANSSQLDLAKHFFELGLKAQQKPAWSKEDEKMYLVVLQDLQNIKDHFPEVNVEPEFNWLKSLKRIGG